MNHQPERTEERPYSERLSIASPRRPRTSEGDREMAVLLPHILWGDQMSTWAFRETLGGGLGAEDLAALNDKELLVLIHSSRGRKLIRGHEEEIARLAIERADEAGHLWTPLLDTVAAHDNIAQRISDHGLDERAANLATWLAEEGRREDLARILAHFRAPALLEAVLDKLRFLPTDIALFHERLSMKQRQSTALAEMLKNVPTDDLVRYADALTGKLEEQEEKQAREGPRRRNDGVKRDVQFGVTAIFSVMEERREGEEVWPTELLQRMLRQEALFGFVVTQDSVPLGKREHLEAATSHPDHIYTSPILRGILEHAHEAPDVVERKLEKGRSNSFLDKALQGLSSSGEKGEGPDIPAAVWRALYTRVIGDPERSKEFLKLPTAPEEGIRTVVRAGNLESLPSIRTVLAKNPKARRMSDIRKLLKTSSLGKVHAHLVADYDLEDVGGSFGVVIENGDKDAVEAALERLADAPPGTLSEALLSKLLVRPEEEVRQKALEHVELFGGASPSQSKSASGHKQPTISRPP